MRKPTRKPALGAEIWPVDKTPCHCEHRLQDTGAVFYQSIGWLECTICNGWQRINKPIFPNRNTP